MAERAEEGMDNQKDCGAENVSLSPKSPLVDAEAMDGRDEGMQKYVNGDDGVPGRENEELLPSPRQGNEAENAIDLEDGFAPPLDQGYALPSPLDEQEESAPIEDASEKGGWIDSTHAADIAPVDMEPQIEGLEEIRQKEAPVEVEQESAVKASAEIPHELDVKPSVEAQSIASDLLETEQERQDLAQPEQGNTGDYELGEGDTSGQEECYIEERQEQLVNAAAGTSVTTGVSQEAGDVQQQGAPELVEKDIGIFDVNPEKSEEQIQDHSTNEELNEQVDLETPIGNVSEEPPAVTVPDNAQEPSLSTPAMKTLIDADTEKPSHELESFGTVEDFEQHLEANETHEDSAGCDRQDEAISNQVEVDNNEQERAENNAFGEDDSSLAAAETADEVLVPSDQELGRTGMASADENDGKEELGNEPPLVFEQETEQLPINEASSVEPHSEQELDIEALLAVGQEAMEQSLDTAPSSSDLETATDNSEKADKAVPLKAEDTINVDGDEVAASEVVEGDAITDSLEETCTENEPGLQALNDEQALDNPHNEESDETFNKQLDTEGLPTGQDKSSVQMDDEALPSEGQTGSSRADGNIDAANGQLDEGDPNKGVQDEQGTTPCNNSLMEANHHIKNCDKSFSLSEPSSEREHEGQRIGDAIATIQFESTADDISNGVLESSVTSEAPNKIHLSEHVLENGDSLRSCPSRENGGEIDGSYVGHSTEPVLELGNVSNGKTEEEAPIMALLEKGLVYRGMTAEDDKHTSSKPLIYNNSESEVESSEVNEVGIQAAEAKDTDFDAGKGKEIVGLAKGLPSHTDATSTSNSLAKQNGFLKHSEGGFEKESEAKDYTSDKENAQAFHNERSREVSLSLVVPQQSDRVSEHMGQKDADRTNGRVTLARRKNWWGCCGMLDLLLHKD